MNEDGADLVALATGDRSSEFVENRFHGTTAAEVEVESEFVDDPMAQGCERLQCIGRISGNDAVTAIAESPYVVHEHDDAFSPLGRMHRSPNANGTAGSVGC